MSKCSSCGRQLGFSFGKKLCRWCVEHEAIQRGEVKDNEYQRVMPTPWKRSETFGASFNHLFIGVSLLVFLAMVGTGIPLMGPPPSQMIQWGGNFGSLTLGGQPWRLITYMFLHYGIIHIGFNMWCLWDLGSLAESLYGDWLYAIIYTLSGIGGGIASMAWHPFGVSAGASGAIFGIAGALIASLKLGEFSLPRPIIAGTLRSVVIFAGYSLVFGAVSGRTDNACHIGGLVTGLIIGALVAVIAPDRDHILRRLAICIVLAAVLFGGWKWLDRSRGYIVLAQRGSFLLEQRQTDEAIAVLQQAVAKRPDDAHAHLDLAHAYAIKGQTAQAISELNRVLQLDPRNESAAYQLGMISYGMHQFAEARKAFSQMLAANPKSAYAYVGLSMVDQAEEKHEAALDQLKKAAALDPESGAYYALGISYAKLKRTDEAINAFKQQQEIAGDDYDTEIALAEAYRTKGMTKEATEATQKAAQMKSD